MLHYRIVHQLKFKSVKKDLSHAYNFEKIICKLMLKKKLGPRFSDSILESEFLTYCRYRNNLSLYAKTDVDQN